MSRYIDADKLTVYFEALAKQAEMEGLYNMAHIHNRCLKIIEDAPTADVVEVRHAEWKYGKENGQYGYYCTICKAGFVGENAEWIAKEHNFCPKCGAKMDGERRDKNEG